MMQSACSLERNVRGPAAYYQCLRDQLQVLRASPGKPDLTGFTSAEQSMMQSACSLERNVRGPATYYQCLSDQLQALRANPGKPDLSGFTSAEQSMMQSACSLERNVRGPAAYYRCLSNQSQAMRASPGKPDLSGFTGAEQSMMQSACSLERNVRGPAAYYECLQHQINSLNASLPEPRQPAPSVKPSSSGQENTAAVRSDEAGIASDAASEVTTKTSPPKAIKSKTPAGLPPPPIAFQAQRRSDPPADAPASVDSGNHSEASRNTPSQTNPNDTNSGWIGLFGVLIFGFIIRALSKNRLKCATCDGALSNGVCRRCQTKEAARKSAEQEEARRAWAEEEHLRAEARRQEEARRREEERRSIQSLEDLQRLSGLQFEELVESLFKRDGYTVRRCGGSGDDGIDLTLMAGNSKDVVQCKRWKADIGSPIIREFYGALMHAGARHGFVITTASFTPSARSFARGKPITLIAGLDLIKWLGGKYSARQEDERQGARQSNGNTNRIDPYAVLGLRTGATRDEVRAAYRNLMTKYHPDKVAHLGIEFQEIARTKALEINRAYEMLGG